MIANDEGGAQGQWMPIGAMHPAPKAHSIQKVEWSVLLGSELLHRDMRLIRDGDARMRKVLPKRNIPDRVWAITDDSPPRQQDASEAEGLPAHLTYDGVQRDGSLDMRLAIEGNRISVERHTYSTWEDSSKVVNQILGDVSASLRDVPVATVSELSLHYEDVFWWRGEGKADVQQLLRAGEKSAPEWVFSTDHEWHVDQGWHAPRRNLPEGAKCIERVALHAVTGKIEDRNRYCVVITTSVRWLLPQGANCAKWSMQRMLAHAAPADASEDRAAEVFNDLHIRANQVFGAVLTPAISGRIGLGVEKET